MYIDLQDYYDFCKPAFNAEGTIVKIPRHVISMKNIPGGCSFLLDSLICRKEAVIISNFMKGRTFAFSGKCEKMILRLEVIDERTLRIRLAQNEKLFDCKQYIPLNIKKVFTSFSVTENSNEFELQTSCLKATVKKYPFQIEVFDNYGNSLYKQYNDDLHNVTANRRGGNREGEENKDGTDESNSFPGFEVFPFGCIENPEKKCAFTESVLVHPNEHFYGFGERFSSLDKNGQFLLNWVINPVGVSNAKSYKCVPFFLSSRGYGVYYNSPRRIKFHMCDYFYKAYECQVEDDFLDYFIFVGNKKEVLNGYTLLTGQSALPPKWAFGIWMSRNCYRTQEEVESIGKKMRDQKLPCDVLHIDWNYCQTFDYDFSFDTKRFPSVTKMSKKLLKKGIHLSVWQIPYIKKSSPIYKEAAEKGLFATEDNDHIADSEENEAILDFSNLETVKWYQEKLHELLKQGIHVIKTDFGENAQDCYQYRNMDGKDMHNLYPLLYNRAAYEICQQVYPNDSLIWGRSAYTGNQCYPVCWGGDSDSDYSGMYHTLRGGLSLGMSGFSFWSHDVGGYFGTPDQDVYIRWLQFGMLSPLVRFHGTSPREPWEFGEEAVREYRKYSAIRYSLLEYIYSEAFDCVKKGLPMLRALTLEFEQDPGCLLIDDEYMLGVSLLIAPVFSKALVRTVYLPAGTNWIDFFTGVSYSGGQFLELPVPIDVMPIFIRCGYAIPFITPMQYVGECPIELIRWEIYLYEGYAYYQLNRKESNIILICRVEKNQCIVTITGEKPRLKINIHDCKAERLIVNDTKQKFTRIDNDITFIVEEG